MNILYIEEDINLSGMVKQKLRSHYNVDVAINGKSGILRMEDKEYDLVIVEYNLSDISGIEICKMVREFDIKTPILIVNNKNKENVAETLDVGADDYLIKPFEFKEFEARIRALLRRNNKQKDRELSVGDLLIGLDDQYISYCNKIIKLPRQEYMLLKYLAFNRGKMVSREELYEHVWGKDGYYNSNTIDVHIKRLRKKMKLITDKDYIDSIYGSGYRI